ncbi:Lrp/AsnC family transcriptional regulator [Arthrobacter sp. UM1]|uniref:Lrp/AsnC family transcriptional regulator n=1 Tax=Arthrobacter sp. UM1 TaxID=2766776 RepID=UPI001CF6911E|nr:Lrp/AsnC ligand binding domain-containing protein [Arthrobacter sp. UM1]MCB4207523.1 Lrp/AsnC ligand binding domain-containing protein [Arthrobacter sp. UM1]
MITAIVHIQTDTSLIPETAQELAAFPEVETVYSVTGEWDLIAIVRVAEHEALADVISDRLSKVQGVAETSTNIAFRTYSDADLDQAYDLGLGD